VFHIIFLGQRMTAIIELRNASKVYHKGAAEIHPLATVSLAIEAGDFVALMGRPVPVRPLC